MNSPLLILQPPQKTDIPVQFDRRENPNDEAVRRSAFKDGNDNLVSQNSFLALILGQVEAGEAIDLDALGIEFSLPDQSAAIGERVNPNVSATAFLNNADTLTLEPGQNLFLNAAQQDINLNAVANNQTQIIDFNQRIQEFLGSLIEYAQGLTGNTDVKPITQPGQLQAANNVPTLSENNTTETPVIFRNIADAVAGALENAGIDNPKLEARISNLIQNNPEAFIKQASLLTSGIGIQDIGLIQNALLNQAGQAANKTAATSTDKIVEDSGFLPIFSNSNEIGKRAASPVTALARENNSASGSQSANLSNLVNNSVESTANNAAVSAQNNVSPQNSSFQMLMDMFLGDNFITANNVVNPSLDPALASNVQPGVDASAARNIVNPQMSVPHAASAHPASESVAVQLQRYANKDGDTRFVIDMDPPQLGKVEVTMKIAKDGGVTANLMIEKPETYMMLQRDAGVLQRAMQEMGLDANMDSFNLKWPEAMMAPMDQTALFQETQMDKPVLRKPMPQRLLRAK